MARLHLPSVDEMTPEQRDVHDEVVSGVRGPPGRPAARRDPQPGPGAALVAARRVPAVLDLPAEEAERARDHRHRAALEQPARVPHPCRGGRPRRASTRRASKRSGSARRRPSPTRRRSKSTSLPGCCSRPATSTDEVHAAVTARWGERGVVELTGVIGYYTMVSMTLNAHEIPLPADASRRSRRRAAAG